ncbi:hypothetical protein CQA57_01150, partial [Helicobacter anseris]
MFLSANIASADSNNYYNGTNVTNGNGTDQCQSASSPCAYTSHGTFTKDSSTNTLNFTNTSRVTGNYTLTAKGVTINVTAPTTSNANANIIDFQKGAATLTLTNSYLKFEDQTTKTAEHFLRALDGSASLTATFNGGIGTETIKNQQYNNIAFYGAMIMANNNSGNNTITFDNGANMVGMFYALGGSGTTAASVKATFDFKGGGNLIATDKDSYMNKWTNIKGKAINFERQIGGADENSNVTFNFGESGQKEYASQDKLDADGVVIKQLNNGDVSNDDASGAKTLITNAIKGNIYVAGYRGGSGVNYNANLTLNFYNNGLIDGAISTSSVANIKIYFANKGTIRSNLVFGMGGDGSTGTFVIAKSANEARVDDLTIEGSITNNGLTNYTVTANKFLMDGTATTGTSTNALTFDTYEATFKNFKLDNHGTTEIKTHNVTFDTFTLNNYKSTTISATESATFNNFSLNNTNKVEISAKTYLVINGASSDITTKGNLTIKNEATSSTTTDAKSSIDVKGIYGIGAYNTTSDTTITTKGNVNVGVLAAVKSDGSGAGSIKNTLTVDNSNNAGSVVLSVIGKDATASDLKLRGGSISGTTLANNQTNLTTRGNIVMFSNMTGGKSELVVSSGQNSSASVVGDIYTIGGTNNIKLSDTTKTDIPEFIGNITANGGSTNLIFDKTLWAPTNVLSLMSQTSMQDSSSDAAKAALLSYISQYGTGTVTSNNSGNVNIVLRQGDSATFTDTALFNVKTIGSSTTTILMQKSSTDLKIGANIDYDNAATTNIIFAGSNDLATSATKESFDTKANLTDVGTTGAQLFGVTYKDGTYFKVGAKTNAQRELIQRVGNTANGHTLTLVADLSGTTSTLSIDGLFMGDITALASSTAAAGGSRVGFTHNVTINTNAIIAGNITNQSTDTLNVVLKAGSKVFIDPTVTKNGQQNYGTTYTMASLTADGATHSYTEDLVDSIKTKNTVVDLGTMGVDLAEVATTSVEAYNLLKITKLGGNNVSFRTRVGDQNKVAKNIGAQNSASDSGSTLTGYADRVIVEGTKGDVTLQEFLQPVYTDNVSVDTITYNETDTSKNIAVLTVKNDSNGKALVDLGALDAIEGFDQISSGLRAVITDANGAVGTDKTGYTTYFLASADSKGASLANQQASAAALGSNYDLYLANMNSLNKRMGELRENANAQGAWARIFNGMQTSNFALETKALYTTFQAGYDYAFGFSGANNYLGFALSYANSITTSSETVKDILNVDQGIKDVTSNAIEFAIYNAYVQDGASKATGFKNGLYTDTILKFSYIMSNLSMLNQSDTYNTNNFALTLSQELGYRFLFGKTKEWSVTPQAEVTFGYLNQSNLKQKLGTAYLDGIQDSIITLRSRIGASYGYDFKQFTENKGFNAKVYLGTYFVGDYIAGGKVSLTSNLGTNVSLSPLASTGRFVMNVGSNFSIKENHRIYFDFERSFGGLITTNYQVNLGY